MHRPSLALFLVLASCLLLPGLRLFADEALWQAARLAWEAGEAYKPGRMVIESDELDRQGRVSSTSRTELRLRYLGDRTLTEVVLATKDGRDITARTQADYDKRESADGGDDQLDQDVIPFTSSLGPYLSINPAVQRAGRRILPYSIVKPKGGSLGEVWLDAQGRPEYLEYRLQPLPAMVSQFEGRIDFQTLPDGAMVIQRMQFRGEGGLLLIRRRFVVRMEFYDYRLN